jgi:hypothetical protein
MRTIRRPLSRKRPGVIKIIAFLLSCQGISDLGLGIWTAITGWPLSYFGAIPVSASDYLLQLLPSHLAQIVFSCLVGILFFVLVWGLVTLKPWAYWVTLTVFLPSWMIYDLSKTLLLCFHVLSPNLFEDPDSSSNPVSFLIELVLFILILRGSVRRSFYSLERSLKFK